MGVLAHTAFFISISIQNPFEQKKRGEFTMTMSYSIDAFRRIDAIDAIFRKSSKLHGYTSIVPGSVSSYKALSNFYPQDLSQSVKYTGPDGNIYMVKSDPTHFVTQLASQNKRTGQAVQKYAYTTSKLSWKSHEGKTKEILQCGLEVYDTPNPLAEAEIIRVAYKVLEESGIGKIIVDLGNISITEILLKKCSLSHREKEKLRDLIDTKNLPELSVSLGHLQLEPYQTKALESLPQLFGSPESVFKMARELTLDTDALRAIKRVETLFKALLDYGLDRNMIKVDFSFTNNYSYYTDNIYKIYTADSGRVLASGGRYDNAFGYGLTACGIALYLNEINEVIEMKQLDKSNLYPMDYAIYYKNDDRKPAIRLSDKLRDLGYTVTTIEGCADNLPTEAEEVLSVKGSQLEIINQRMNTFCRSSFDQFIRKVEDQYAPSSIH